MDRIDQLPPSLQAYLRDFVARWRQAVGLRAAGTALAVLALCALGTCLADRLMHLPGMIRLLLLVGGAAGAFVAGLVRLAPLRSRTDWVAMAALIEEQDSRFQQRLITVTSRILGAPEHRGSDEILSHLLREVEQLAAGAPPGGVASLRTAAVPWAIFLGVGLLMFGAAQAPSLGVRQLLARWTFPLSQIPPVTTTQLRISPQGADVLQSEPLKIEAEALRLGTNPVWIYFSDDAGAWTRSVMEEISAGHFAFTVSAVGRDMSYYVSAGDAVSPIYSIRVKRAPSVAEFRVRYSYPAYTEKAPFTVTNSDGAIEGPSGSQVTLTIVATEPLQSALLTVGDQKILMDRTGSDDARQATFAIQRDQNYDLDLISTRDMRGGPPGKLTIRTIVDHPPVVRLVQAGQILRIGPRRLLALPYIASDDYGLASLTLVAAANDSPPRRIPLRIEGDRRRQQGTVDFDLATGNFAVGDIVTISLDGYDSAGQEGISDELRVLVTPGSMDLDARPRIEALSNAARSAATLSDELQAAGKAIEDADAHPDHQSGIYLAASADQSRHLAAASEAATLLKQELLRAIAHSGSTEMSDVLAEWIDLAQQEAHAAEDLFQQSAAPRGLDRESRQGLRQALTESHEMADDLGKVGQGERSAAILAVMQDLKAVQASPSSAEARGAGRLTQVVSRLNDEMTADAADVGVDVDRPDAAARLRSHVESEQQVLQSRPPLDLAAAAKVWSQDLQRQPRARSGFDIRLETAAQAEALRSDADFSCARDWQLASQEVANAEAATAQAPAGRPVAMGPINAIANDLAALRREHLLNRQPPSARFSEEGRAARASARLARDDLSKLIRESIAAKRAVPVSHSADLESLAFRAASDWARRDYKRAIEADRAFAQKLTESARKALARPILEESNGAVPLAEDRTGRTAQTIDAVAKHAAAAEALDKLSQAQEKLLQESRAGKPPAELAATQRGLADRADEIARQNSAIASLSPGEDQRGPRERNWRVQALETLAAARDRLAALPQQLAAAQESAALFRRSADAADVARERALNVPAETQFAKLLAEENASQQAYETELKLQKALAPVGRGVADDLARRLKPILPETALAPEPFNDVLAPALAAFQSAAHGADAGAVTLAIAQVRQAIDAMNKNLSQAQEIFVDYDPLLAARWFARTAADALGHRPADLKTAIADQMAVASALSRAWQAEIRSAADLRLAALPSLQSAYAASLAASSDNVPAAGLASNIAARDWAIAHPHEGDDPAGTFQDADPPGFEEALHLYFDGIAKAQAKAKSN